MISLQEIIPWRANAPWSNDLMVEQDFLLCRSVQAIFGDAKLKKQLAMRGGTVLHKAHLAPASRYSEDIDLVLVANRSPKGIKEDIARVLEPVLGKPSESVVTTVTLAVRNLFSKSEIARITYVCGPTSALAAHAHLKIEVNLNEQENLYPLTHVDMDVPGPGRTVEKCPVVSYDIDEMLGTKLRALLQREHGRDLYDLWRAWAASQAPGATVVVDPRRVGTAFRFYMAQEKTSFSAKDAQAELQRRMQSRKFLEDMNGFLPPGVQYDPHGAYRVFLEVFLPHLDA